MNEKKLLWVAIAAGVVAVVCVEGYVSARVGTPVQVLFAKKDLAEGHVFLDGDVEARPVDGNAVPKGALTSASRGLVASGTGARARSTIRGGSPIFAVDVGGPADVKLSEKIPEGKRAISIRVSEASSVTNMICPDDEVEILVADAQPGQKTTVDRVSGRFRVLAVGAHTDPSLPDAAPNYNTVTLLVTPEEATAIVGVIGGPQDVGKDATLLLCGRAAR